MYDVIVPLLLMVLDGHFTPSRSFFCNIKSHFVLSKLSQEQLIVRVLDPPLHEAVYVWTPFFCSVSFWKREIIINWRWNWSGGITIPLVYHHHNYFHRPIFVLPILTLVSCNYVSSRGTQFSCSSSQIWEIYIEGKTALERLVRGSILDKGD